MRHYQSADQSCTYSPTRSPNVFLLVFLVQKFYFKCFCKILSQEMRSAALQCFSILHQSFNAICIDSAGKSFAFRFYTPDHRQSHKLLCKSCIHFKHLFCFFNCIFRSSMCSMTFLPKKFCRTQKQSCSHFPTYHICPLVDEQWEITI